MNAPVAVVPPAGLLETFAAWSVVLRATALIIAGLVYVGGVVTGGGLTLFLTGSGSQQINASSPIVASVNDEASAVAPSSSEPTPSSLIAANTQPPPSKIVPRSTSSSSAPPPAPANTAPTPAAIPQPVASSTSAPPASGENPFRDLAARGYVLDLPEATTARAEAVAAKVYVDNVADCRLELVGAEQVFGNQMRVALTPRLTDDPAKRTWAIEMAISTFGRFGDAQPVAVVSLDARNAELLWKWAIPQPTGFHAEALAFCLLKVTVGNRSEICALAKPRRVPPFRVFLGATAPADPMLQAVTLKHNEHKGFLPVSAGIAATPGNLRVELRTATSQQPATSHPLPAGRIGNRFPMSDDPDVPGYLDVEWTTSKSVSGELGWSISLLGRQLRCPRPKYEWQAVDDAPLSGDELNGLLKHLGDTAVELNGALRRQEAVAAKKIESDPNWIGLKRRESSLNQQIATTTSSITRTSLSDQLKDVRNQLKQLESSVPQNRQTQTNARIASEAKKYEAGYEAIRNNLSDFAQSVVFTYRVTLDHSQRSFILFETDSSPNGPPNK